MHLKNNIILIGMPASGKSTIGVLLAKAMGKGFIDCDLLIQQGEGRTLVELIADQGLEAFCALEEEYTLSLDCTDSIIAPGGSIVYRPKAMQHLKSLGTVVFIDVPLAEIERRLGDFSHRGVVLESGQTLESLYTKRHPLYEQYADIILPCANYTHALVLDTLLDKLKA